MKNTKKERVFQIGEVYIMSFEGTGSEQNKVRPGLVFQNNVGNIYSPNIIALPMTGQLKKVDQPTHVIVRAKDTGLKMDSVVLCENPQRMSKEKIKQYITTLPDEYMRKIAEANLLATSAISFLDIDLLKKVWEKAVALNATASI